MVADGRGRIMVEIDLSIKADEIFYNSPYAVGKKGIHFGHDQRWTSGFV